MKRYSKALDFFLLALANVEAGNGKGAVRNLKAALASPDYAATVLSLNRHNEEAETPVTAAAKTKKPTKAKAGKKKAATKSKRIESALKVLADELPEFLNENDGDGDADDDNLQELTDVPYEDELSEGDIGFNIDEQEEPETAEEDEITGDEPADEADEATAESEDEDEDEEEEVDEASATAGLSKRVTARITRMQSNLAALRGK